jgi:hypothetical protein
VYPRALAMVVKGYELEAMETTLCASLIRMEFAVSLLAWI